MNLNNNNKLTPEQAYKWAEWIDALESGDYKQTNGWLRATPEGKKKDRFCCLGVLCDLNPHVEWDTPPNNENEITVKRALYNKDDDHSGSLTELPWALREDLNISFDLQTLLIRLNDAGAPFKAIAVILRNAAGFAPRRDDGQWKAVDEVQDFTPVPD